MNQQVQGGNAYPERYQPSERWRHNTAVRGLIIPNPKLKLLDQVREVMRLKHYSIRTEQCYCDWIRRYIKFQGMRSREESPGERTNLRVRYIMAA